MNTIFKTRRKELLQYSNFINANYRINLDTKRSKGILRSTTEEASYKMHCVSRHRVDRECTFKSGSHIFYLISKLSYRIEVGISTILNTYPNVLRDFDLCSTFSLTY